MQRIFLIFPLLFLLSISSFSQKKSALIDKRITVQHSNKLLDKSIKADTSFVFHSVYGSGCDSLTILPTEGGFVFGPNEFGDTEKGIRLEFENPGIANVFGAIGYFFTDEISGDGNIHAVLYSVDDSGAPDEEIARSLPVKASEVVPVEDGMVSPTLFAFEEIVSLSGSEVILTIDFSALYETGDQLSLVSTYAECGTVDDAWERWGDGQWFTMNNAWNAPSSWTPYLGILLETDVNGACEVEGGVIEGGPFTFCVGDGTDDMLGRDALILSNNSGENSQWVVTDSEGKILGLPSLFNEVNFDDAGAGTCLLWHLSYDGELVGAVIDSNANNLDGCFNLSNPITINRVTGDDCPTTGGGDAITVNIAATKDATIFSEDANGSNGAGDLFTGRTNQPSNRRTLIQFDLSAIPTNVTIVSATMTLTGSKQSTSSIDLHRLAADWGEGTTTGTGTGGGQASDAQTNDATWSHGFFNNTAWTNSGGDFADESSANAGISNNNIGSWSGDLMVQDIQMWNDGNAENFGWILIGDETTSGSAVRMVSKEGNSAEAPALQIVYTAGEMMECEVAGGTLEGGPFAFCVGDDVADMIGEDEITLTGNTGANSQWVVTDPNGKILGLPGSFTDVNFDGAGAGTCLVWHLSFDGDLMGAAVDSNANNLQGCFSLSNPIEVVRSQPAGGTLEGGPFAFCVGDDVADMIGEDEITLTGNTGANSQWVVT
ncbi:MAG: hypothetical protein ACJA01_003600, partial [Saprospiraceae bacterium]